VKADTHDGLRDATMALTPTIHRFEIELADVDRGVYESIALRLAREPSETAEFLLTRVFAYCLEHTDGIEISGGIAAPDEPALCVRDLTGSVRAWIDIGAPDAARLHKASKATPRVAVYTHKDPAGLVRQLAGERIHRAEALEIHAIDRGLLAELAARLGKRMVFGLTVTDRQLYVAMDGKTFVGSIETRALEPRA